LHGGPSYPESRGARGEPPPGAPERGTGVGVPGAAGSPGPNLAARRIQLSPSVAVTPRSGQAGFTAVRTVSPRSSIILQQQINPAGKTQVSAYQQSVSADGRTTTRTYLDGHRSIDAPSFHSSGTLNGPQFVHYSNGLHAAYLANGRAAYAERFTKIPGVGASGSPALVPAVQRSIYATSRFGHIVMLPTPIRRTYLIESVGAYPTFVYSPAPFPVPLFGVLFAPFAVPIVVGPQCLVCPGGSVAFATPQASYADPVALLGDEQIADAAADNGMAPVAAPPGGPPPDGQPPDGQPPPDQLAPPQEPTAAPDTPDAPPPELTTDAQGADAMGTLRSRVGELQTQVQQRAAKDAASAEGAGDESLATLHPASLVTTSDAPAAEGDANPINIPEDVREEMRKQVRLGIAQDANGRALTLNEVIHAGYAPIFLFQVSSSLDTVSAVTGDRCELGSGDILGFTDQGYDESHPAAQMKVVVARPGHCLVEDTVDMSPSDLQEMLNTFNERLESNMQKLGGCVVDKGSCVPTS
jgi:hypothetical protein